MFSRRGLQGWMALALLLFSADLSHSAAEDEILGTWRGTSTCVNLKKYPACKNEVVIYTFTAVADSPGKVHLKADKVVNKEIITMYEIDFTRNEQDGSWVAEFEKNRNHGLWKYTIQDSEMKGTLVDLPSKDLVREIAVHKDK